MRHIKNVKELRQALADGEREFKIHLCGGGVVSRKYIAPCRDGRFGITNYIDGITQRLTARQLHTESNIGKAMKQNAFTLD
jgi:hypothetical protein